MSAPRRPLDSSSQIWLAGLAFTAAVVLVLQATGCNALDTRAPSGSTELEQACMIPPRTWRIRAIARAAALLTSTVGPCRGDL
jgi:hypothetical protein